MIQSRFIVDGLKVGPWRQRHYYHFGRLRVHGDMNIYESSNRFDWRLIRKAAHAFAAGHGFRVETQFYPKENALYVARIAPPASVLRHASLNTPLLTAEIEEQRRKRRKDKKNRLKWFESMLRRVQPLTTRKTKLHRTV